jgi:uncharacterized RDD family membrane protein YckC
MDLDSASASGNGVENSFGRESGALSTMASQPIPTSSWKLEVNRRVAAHKNRRGSAAAEQEKPAEALFSAGTLAAQAAARVAARYAKAPTYSQMQAAEARTAVRAAKIATDVALEAQAAARAALANLESASTAEPEQGISQPAAEAPYSPSPVQAPRRAPLEFHLEPELPVRHERTRPQKHLRQHRDVELLPRSVEEWWQAEVPPADPLGARELDRIEAALPETPVHANLIEFPHEQASTRSVRTQVAAAPPDAPAPAGQLSIFEVDPTAVSIHMEEALAHPGASQWSGIELEAHPVDDHDADALPVPEAAGLQLAAFSRRAMAALVDAALITGAFLVAALLAAVNVDRIPSVRLLEIGFGSGLFVIGLLYQAFFFTLAHATPGMKYARISLCTFDDQSPTRRQLHGRLGALLLSILPMGLGLAWAIFDEDHLSWHDRLSKTYQRKCEP